MTKTMNRKNHELGIDIEFRINDVANTVFIIFRNGISFESYIIEKGMAKMMEFSNIAFPPSINRHIDRMIPAYVQQFSH